MEADCRQAVVHMSAAEGSHIAEGIENSVVEVFDYQHYLIAEDYHQQDYSQSLKSKMFSSPFFLVNLNSKEGEMLY